MVDENSVLPHHACMLSRFSCVRLFATPRTVAHQALCPRDSPGKNPGVGCHDLLHHHCTFLNGKFEERKNVSRHVKVKFQCP